MNCNATEQTIDMSETDETIEANEKNSSSQSSNIAANHCQNQKLSTRTKRVIDDKNRKKDEKYVDSLIRNLKAEDKLPSLINKCVELLAERRNLEQTVKVAEKNFVTLRREFDQVISEKNRQMLVNSRLESLCRELQKHNKAIKEETCKRIKDEEEKRKEVSVRFQQTINEISNMMQEGNENNTKLRDDNATLTTKFQILCSHVEKREEQVNTLIKQMDLERKLAEASIEQRNCELLACQEQYRKDKQILQNEVETQKLQCDELRRTCENLRSQIVMYKEQCDDFNTAVAKSNSMFERFQIEMDKMSKKLQAMEKECIRYQEKCKQANLSLIEVCRENQQLKVDQVHHEKQLQVLKDLCRAMQGERVGLFKQLDQLAPANNYNDVIGAEQIFTDTKNTNTSIKHAQHTKDTKDADKKKTKKDIKKKTNTAQKDTMEQLRVLKSDLCNLQEELKSAITAEQQKEQQATSSQVSV